MKKIFLLLLLACISLSIRANDVSILTVTGKISRTNSQDKKAFVFSFDELKKLSQVSIRTQSIWLPESTFVGPKVSDVLAKVGMLPEAKEVAIKSIDNYPIAIPISDFMKWEVIFAHTINNKRLLIDNKGPLWIIYPHDKYPEDLKNNVTNIKSAWSVTGIEIR